MGYVLDLAVLKKKLARSKVRKDAPQSILKHPPEEEPPADLRYLIDNVLEPLLDGKPVHSGDIDFSRFDRDTLTDLYEYYTAHYIGRYYDVTSAWYALRRVYTACDRSDAQTMPIDFI